MNAEELINIVSEISEVDVVVTDTTHLVNDLKFDSLKFIDLLIMLEGEFDLVIPDEKMVDIEKIEDILKYTESA